ncbi:MAG TPA: hypothetical protein VII01_01920 [Solirubrobacteraceae bacterium]|jgi:hypothetical protein
MSADPGAGPGQAAQGGAGPAGGQPSEEELRAAYEAELDRITVIDMMAQAAVSLLNVGARKLSGGGEGTPGAPGPVADLEQARDAIDGAHALLEILERRIPQELAPLRDALSRLQMAYARDAQAAGGPAPKDAQEAPPAEQPGAAGAERGGAASDEKGEGPGPAEASGRLWVPGR